MKKPKIDFVYIRGDDDLLSIPNDSGLYLIYGNKNKLLYIGIATYVRERIRDHFKGSTNTKEFSHEFNYVCITLWDSLEVGLLEAESILIEKLKPKYNKANNYKKYVASVI